MIPKLKKFVPQSESELHTLIQEELDAIEEGLVLLQHEYPSGKGVVDFLCVDSGGTLVIIEVKLHEDENILFQALRYYSDIEKNRYLVSTLFTGKHIDPEDPPRLVLVAEGFSDDIRRLSTLVVPEVELLEYSAVTLPGGEQAILYYSVSLPGPVAPPAEPKTIDKLIDYLTEESLKSTLTRMRNAIKGIGKGIEEYATQRYIGYRHSGRQFAYISVFRRVIEVGALIVDERKQLLDYEGVRIETGEEDFTEIMGKIKTSFVNLGGRLED